jgi:hypothetical protein
VQRIQGRRHLLPMVPSDILSTKRCLPPPPNVFAVRWPILSRPQSCRIRVR